MAPQPSRPIITLEEHFLSRVATENLTRENAQLKKIPGLFDKFTELGPKRLEDMDAGQVAIQVISHGPGDLDAEMCRQSNDQLADAVRTHPGRFAGFAALPMIELVDVITAELRRTCGGSNDDGEGGGGFSGANAGVKFVGALIDSHSEEGEYYDRPDYDPLWQAAVDLDVPIYIHPTWPTGDTWRAHFTCTSLPQSVTDAILAFGFGWHSDVAMHVLKLYAAGVFDRFPALKIIIGHMGEMIPYMFQRIERVSARWGRARSFREVWDSNFWVTTSGNWSLDPMACMLRNTKRERIMYSVDYPFATSEDGLRWLHELEESGMVSAEELEGIRWRNAARLLKLDVKAE